MESVNNYQIVLDAVHRLIVTQVPQFRPQGALELAATIVEQLDLEMDGKLFDTAQMATDSAQAFANEITTPSQCLVFMGNVLERADERQREITEADFVKAMYEHLLVVLPNEDPGLIHHHAERVGDVLKKVYAPADADKAPRWRKALLELQGAVTAPAAARKLFKITDRDLARYVDHAPKFKQVLSDALHQKFAEKVKDFDPANLELRINQVVCKAVKDGLPIEAISDPVGSLKDPSLLIKILAAL